MITTAGKSANQVINEVFEKLIAQGGQCIDGDDCAYGDDEGNHCAVGWLLPESNGHLMMSNKDIHGIIKVYDDLGPNDKFIRANGDLLDAVQTLHDASKLSARFHAALHLARKGADPRVLTKWVYMADDAPRHLNPAYLKKESTK